MQEGKPASIRMPRVSVAESIAEKILEMIASGAFQVGDALPTEKEFTVLFGVGRSSVREALRALQSIGVIETRQGYGSFVKSTAVSKESVFHIPNILQRFSVADLSEARKLIEEQTTALAANNATTDNLAAMQEANNRLRFHLDSSEEDKIVQMDFDVHRAIAEGSGNAFLLEMLDMLLGIFRDLNEAVVNRSSILLAIELHQQVIDSIGRRDADGARDAMSQHLDIVHLQIIEKDEAAEAEDLPSNT